jgi:hypothetical protein
MAEKRRYTVSLPDHVAKAMEARAKDLGSAPTEYAGDILRWWFGQGCPPATADEAELRKTALLESIRKRTKPLPRHLDVWSLNAEDTYAVDGDEVIEKLLEQLGIPNLFARAAQHDSLRVSVTFDNHPTHWLVIDLFKGSNRPDGDGMFFEAYPKSSISKEAILARMRETAKELGSSDAIVFSQLPSVGVRLTKQVTSQAKP